jgi:hypothetical protein
MATIFLVEYQGGKGLLFWLNNEERSITNKIMWKGFLVIVCIFFVFGVGMLFINVITQMKAFA